MEVVFILFFIGSFLTFVFGTLQNIMNMMLVGNLFLLLGIMFYAYSRKDRGILLLLFCITFFTFLLGEYTVKMFYGEVWWGKLGAIATKHTLRALYLSLFFIFCGYIIYDFFKKRKIVASMKTYVNIEYIEIQRISLFLYYVTFVFALIVIIEPAIFVHRNTYIDMYMSYKTKLPIIIHKLAQSNEFLFYIYLSAFPAKKNLKLPLFLFLIINLISLFTGIRGRFVVSLFIVIFYFAYRHYIDKREGICGEPWIKKSYIYFALVVAPLLISFLSIYNLIRSGIEIRNFDIGREFLNFFETQGGSANVITYGKLYEKSLPDTNVSYLFGPIISFFKNGFLGSIFTGNAYNFAGNKVSIALYGNNFGATITYLVMRDNYLSGVGLGTQYIAEAYADFGYFGVCVFSGFLGSLINFVNLSKNREWYKNAILLSIVSSILSMPRNFAMTWVASLISIMNWSIILCIYLYSNSIKNSKEKIERK